MARRGIESRRPARPFLTTGVALLVVALVAIPVVTTQAIEAARAVA